MVISPEPLKTGLAIVPLTLASSARSPSSWMMVGKNCRMKFTELRAILTDPTTGVFSSTFPASIIFETLNGRLASI